MPDLPGEHRVAGGTACEEGAGSAEDRKDSGGGRRGARRVRQTLPLTCSQQACGCGVDALCQRTPLWPPRASSGCARSVPALSLSLLPALPPGTRARVSWPPGPRAETPLARGRASAEAVAPGVRADVCPGASVCLPRVELSEPHAFTVTQKPASVPQSRPPPGPRPHPSTARDSRGPARTSLRGSLPPATPGEGPPRAAGGGPTRGAPGKPRCQAWALRMRGEPLRGPRPRGRVPGAARDEAEASRCRVGVPAFLPPPALAGLRPGRRLREVPAARGADRPRAVSSGRSHRFHGGFWEAPPLHPCPLSPRAPTRGVLPIRNAGRTRPHSSSPQRRRCCFKICLYSQNSWWWPTPRGCGRPPGKPPSRWGKTIKQVPREVRVACFCPGCDQGTHTEGVRAPSPVSYAGGCRGK